MIATLFMAVLFCANSVIKVRCYFCWLMRPGFENDVFLFWFVCCFRNHLFSKQWFSFHPFGYLIVYNVLDWWTVLFLFQEMETVENVFFFKEGKYFIGWTFAEINIFVNDSEFVFISLPIILVRLVHRS